MPSVTFDPDNPNDRAFVLRVLQHYQPISLVKRQGGRILTPEQIAEVRRLAATGQLTQREIGAQMGVNHRTISAIIRGLIYRDVPYE